MGFEPGTFSQICPLGHKSLTINALIIVSTILNIIIIMCAVEPITDLELHAMHADTDLKERENGLLLAPDNNISSSI